jgi:hypothetical protein
MARMKRIITGAIFSAALSVLVYVGLVYLEGYYLYDVFQAQPSGKVKLDTWINEFYANALPTIMFALLGILVWYLIGYFKHRIANWKKSKGFLAWLLIFVLSTLAAFAYGYYFTKPTEDLGKYFACLFFLGNGALLYWLSTAVFSPPTVKYVPLGSIRLRLARLGNSLTRRLG